MKVVKAQEMARLEALAYATGSSEESFMHRAAEGIAEWIQWGVGHYHLRPKIRVLCGRGNNGGDAFRASYLLRQQQGGFEVTAYTWASFEECSALCQAKWREFEESGGTVIEIKKASDIPLTEQVLYVDGLLGTGFHGEVTGLLREIIHHVNQAPAPIFAIDIPSGVNGNTGEVGGEAIVATETLFLGLPKIGCFLGSAWNHTGKIKVFDFGLPKTCVDKAEGAFVLIEEPIVKHLLPRIERARHKYQAGYVVGWGGSIGMPGAPLMSSYASLRAGAGIVRLLHPEGIEAELTSSPLEVIKESYPEKSGSSHILEAFSRAKAVFVGPGLGTTPLQRKLFKKVVPRIDKPCVIDADALTLLAHSPCKLPSQAILTPHQGEMKRLLGEKEISLENLLHKTQDYAKHHRVVIVLKGAPTFIFQPIGASYICANGDPGMATAGSGDVLTGILAALLAQGKDPLEAAILGVFLHASAGEMVAEEKTSYGMIATDLIEALPVIFKKLLYKKI